MALADGLPAWQHAGMKFAEFQSEAGASDAEISTATGIDKSTLSRVRRGLKRPSWKVMIALARFTEGKVMPNDFLDAAESAEDR